MRFSKQPNGRWCGYSTISDSFYHVHLTDKKLVAAVIADTTRLDFACDKVPDPTSSDDLVEYCQTVCDLVEYCQKVCDRSAERINRLFHDGGYDFDQIIDHFRYDNDKRESRAFWIRRFKYMGCDKEQMERVNARIDWLEENDDLYHSEKGQRRRKMTHKCTNCGGAATCYRVFSHRVDYLCDNCVIKVFDQKALEHIRCEACGKLGPMPFHTLTGAVCSLKCLKDRYGYVNISEG